MYNIIKLKFTVIASCGANIVILSSKQYLIHRKIENNNSCEGMDLNSKSKKTQQQNQKQTTTTKKKPTKIQDILS